VADAYVEILPPLVKDCELDLERAASHDLMVLGVAGDNRLLADLETDLPLELGRNWFRWRGVDHGRPDQGLVVVLPNPANPDRVMYVVAANSALQLWRMTRRFRRDLPSWALFQGDEVVEEGYHAPAAFRFALPEE
jgi:hypothetical protein